MSKKKITEREILTSRNQKHMSKKKITEREILLQRTE
jgi:hypothetical protein